MRLLPRAPILGLDARSAASGVIDTGDAWVGGEGSMGFNRWLWFSLVVAVLLATALATRFWPQPIPQITCNEPLFDAKVLESVAVG
jgi:hypothetical protein